MQKIRISRTGKTLDYGFPVRRPFGTLVFPQHEYVLVLGGVLHGGAVKGFTIVGRDAVEKKSRGVTGLLDDFYEVITYV